MLSENRSQIYTRRLIANAIDFGIEFGSALLGGYFGAMTAALVVVLNKVSPIITQKAVWTGMMFGFVFWGLISSLVNRVLVQGLSRATVGKKLMNLEIVSTGAPITWKTMVKLWISGSLLGDIEVVSSLDGSKLAEVHSIHSHSAAPLEAQASSESADKKAA